MIAEGSLQIAATPEVVWDVISDLAAWPTWNRGVRSVTLDGPLQPGTGFRWKAGSSTLVSTLRVVDAPREIGWTGKTMGIPFISPYNPEGIMNPGCLLPPRA